MRSNCNASSATGHSHTWSRAEGRGRACLAVPSVRPAQGIRCQGCSQGYLGACPVTVVVTLRRRYCCRVGVVTKGTREQNQETVGMSTRAAPWLAWSLWTITVALTALSALLVVLSLSRPNAAVFEWWFGNTFVVIDA